MERRRHHSSLSSAESRSVSHQSPSSRSPVHNGDVSAPNSRTPSTHSFSPYGNESVSLPSCLRNSMASSQASSTSNVGIGERTLKRLSVTASTLALRSDEDRAREARRRSSALAWDRLLDDELDGVPWRRRHLVRLFARCMDEEGGVFYDVLELVPQDVLDRVSSLLRRPLVRLGVEAQRLASRFQRCTKHEVLTAMRLVLPTSLSEGAASLAAKAYSLYGVSMQRYSFSKSARCDVSLPIGRFHRWMLEQEIAPVVSDCASVHLCAAMEHLVEVTFNRCVRECVEDGERTTREGLEQRISSDADLWALLQPHAYLVPCRSGRTSNFLSVSSSNSWESPQLTAKSDITTSSPPRSDSSRNPSGMSREPDGASAGSELVRSTRAGSRRSSRASHRRLDAQPLVVTTVRSRIELASLVSRALYYIQQGAHTSQHVVLSPTSIDVLYYYMSSVRSKQHGNAAVPHATRSSPFTVDVRAPASLPALGEWLRIALVMVEHRNMTVVDEDDIRQTARLLLPGVDCPARSLRLDEALCSARQLDAEHCAIQFQQDLGFHMLLSGRTDLVREAIPLLGKRGVNSFNMQGLSPLMYAAANGDEALIQLLLQAKANPNLAVASGGQKGWTAVTFAVLHGHVPVLKILLEGKANPEGSYLHNHENTTDTPLQLASSAGRLEIVGLLLAFGADPFVTTLHNNMTTTAANSQGWQGSCNSFARAASDGHRKVLKKLLAQPPPSTRSCDMLSLEDILAEGYVHTQDKGHSLSRAKALQEAMYMSSEHGYVDISMELRSLGIPWNLHCWTETVVAADRARKLDLIVMLLRDFASLSHEELTEGFCRDGLPMLFSLFRKYNDDTLYRQLSVMLSNCYGDLPPPRPQELPYEMNDNRASSPRIGPEFVNNPEMSDVTFVVEGQLFYAHRIILVTASSKFKAMLSAKFPDGSKPRIEIPNMKYDIFKVVIQYIYEGSHNELELTPSNVMEVIQAANFFLLDGLQRHCEVYIMDLINVQNALELYRHGWLFGAEAMLAACEGFFLANMPAMMEVPKFRKLFTSEGGQDLIHELRIQLSERIMSRLQHPGSPIRGDSM